jgi:hypothetical protein
VLLKSLKFSALFVSLFVSEVLVHRADSIPNVLVQPLNVRSGLHPVIVRKYRRVFRDRVRQAWLWCSFKVDHEVFLHVHLALSSRTTISSYGPMRCSLS